MRFLACVAAVCSLSACGIFGSSDSKPEAQPASNAPAPDPREAEKAELRARISARQQDLDQANSDLTKIATERDQLAGQAASDAKTNRLIELQRLENDTKQKKASLTEEIAQLKQQLSGASSAPVAAKPAKSADPLDDIIATNESKEKEEAERRRKQADEAAAADKARLAQADAAQKAEMEERSKQKVEGGRLAVGDDAAPFEDRWADAIHRIQAELQKYKRW